ncbi:aminotransferase class I/II-fold pyridoxal phosphate-dependent enzyme [Frigidibacter sp. ROC022]|uniref:aminotransferase class I/II-fold pyridoxal phosphate-dependent enzyme n=1 Tax=Frigidibacter sp. ROC022 TaxID=2971796 RepID=UPI00215B74B0|nr:pyridoxal phosphate-dependent aminotransferase family protein [Frigidibacter sp. ROC022]MCR8725744.1 pyridoxal phosphate-dependent aminotransferase family protein [Frigidibacter sp. ROC022]
MAGAPDRTMRMESPLAPRMRINGREVDYFCGTSYYCLHGHPQVIEAACAATRRFGMGPGTGAAMQIYDDLQAALREWFGADHVTYVISGYTSPMVMLQGLRDDVDLVLADAASHYSVRDAMATLGLPVHCFRHLSPESLAEALAEHVRPGQRPAVVTDGVFPSSGALAPLPDYVQVMAGYDGARLCVDDSHGIGVLGDGGRGALEHHGVEGPRAHVAGTMSKAFGGLGGIVPCDRARAERIAANAGILRGASPPPPAAAAAGLTGMRLLRETPEMLASLRRNTAHMRQGLRDLGFDLPDTPVPIVTLRASQRRQGADIAMLRDHLATQDIFTKLTPAGGYSDAPDEDSMRIAVFSGHRPEQIDRLLTTLADRL